MFNATNLQDIDLSDNGMEVPPPNSANGVETVSRTSVLEKYTDVGLNGLPMLRRLDLSRNRISGPLPLLRGSGGNLRELRLELQGANQANNYKADAKCGFSGTIPETWSYMSNLRHLNLSHNRVEGPLRGRVNMMISLRELDLTANQVDANTNEVVDHVGGADDVGAFLFKSLPLSIRWLALGHNKISGVWRTGWGYDHPNLEYVYNNGCGRWSEVMQQGREMSKRMRDRGVQRRETRDTHGCRACISRVLFFTSLTRFLVLFACLSLLLTLFVDVLHFPHPPYGCTRPPVRPSSRYVSLRGNLISGALPVDLMSLLEHVWIRCVVMDLRDNALTGALPEGSPSPHLLLLALTGNPGMSWNTAGKRFPSFIMTNGHFTDDINGGDGTTLAGLGVGRPFACPGLSGRPYDVSGADVRQYYQDVDPHWTRSSDSNTDGLKLRRAPASDLVVKLDPAYYGYTLCRCHAGYFPSPAVPHCDRIPWKRALRYLGPGQGAAAVVAAIHGVTDAAWTQRWMPGLDVTWTWQPHDDIITEPIAACGDTSLDLANCKATAGCTWTNGACGSEIVTVQVCVYAFVCSLYYAYHGTGSDD